MPGNFEVGFEFGEHEFRVLKRNVQERFGVKLISIVEGNLKCRVDKTWEKSIIH